MCGTLCSSIEASMPPRLGLTAWACCRLLVHSRHIISAGTSPDSTPRCSFRSTCTDATSDHHVMIQRGFCPVWSPHVSLLAVPCPALDMCKVAFGSAVHCCAQCQHHKSPCASMQNCLAALMLAARLLQSVATAKLRATATATSCCCCLRGFKLSQSHLGTELGLQLQELPPSLQDSPLLIPIVVC